eukprot:256190-Chlamydomonas_euryale.AAC.9
MQRPSKDRTAPPDRESRPVFNPCATQCNAVSLHQRHTAAPGTGCPGAAAQLACPAVAAQPACPVQPAAGVD